MSTPTVINIYVTFEPDDQLLYTREQTARRLGRGITFLKDLAVDNPQIQVYTPVVRNLRSCLYSGLQIKLIALILKDQVSQEQGDGLWKKLKDTDLNEVLQKARTGN